MGKKLFAWEWVWKSSAKYLPEMLRKEVRWRIAREEEKEFWLNLPQDEFQAQAAGYKSLAEQMLERLQARSECGKNFRALQIGCAVEDAIFYFPYGQLYAIDPLSKFYKAHFKISNNPKVDYRQARGEKIPFPSRYFDLIVCQNALDHVMDYRLVLNEIKRTLKSEGIVYFGVDVYPPETAGHRIEAKKKDILFDLPHPHTFTVESFDNLMDENDFNIFERYPMAPSGKGDDSERYCIYVMLAKRKRALFKKKERIKMKI